MPGSHGLLVAADTVDEAATRLEHVCARLEQPRRSCSEPTLDALARPASGSGYRLPEDPRRHDVALESAALASLGAHAGPGGGERASAAVA